MFDVTDPVDPLLVGSVITPGVPHDVEISGHYAYVADSGYNGLSGLRVIDISDPAVPVIVAGVGTPDNSRSVTLSGTHAYVANHDDGLQVIDISDPQDPVLIGSRDTGYAVGVAISDTGAYIADSSFDFTVLPFQCDPMTDVFEESVAI